MSSKLAKNYGFICVFDPEESAIAALILVENFTVPARASSGGAADAIPRLPGCPRIVDLH